MFEIHFACSAFDEMIFAGSTYQKHIITSVTASEALAALKKGKWIYTEKVLAEYIREDLKLINEVQPDIILHDCRLSMNISAPLFNVPLVNLINAYWSPLLLIDKYPLPEHPILQLTGTTIGSMFFPMAQAVVFRQFAGPVNKLRKKYGLREIGSLHEALTYGDYVIYPDIPELIRLKKLPENHFFIGPVLWSPACRSTSGDLPFGDHPFVYATLGSSGAATKLPLVAKALEESKLFSTIATAGRTKLVSQSPTTYISDFLPGELYSRHASVVISNGGSSTGYQALANGTPVLGIASNLDQYLCMNAIEKAGAGLLVRSDSLNVKGLKKSLRTILKNPGFTEQAKRLEREFSKYDSGKLFLEVILKVLADSKSKKVYANLKEKKSHYTL